MGLSKKENKMRILLSIIILLLVAGIASASEIGKASFYTVKSSGLQTANGERYNEDALTCASLDYKFNTLLKVTNIENGKAVIVRVNDTGGFKKYGRIIDLSKGAFSKIANLKQGIITVKIEVMK
jgi:rare lipoprotein A